MRMKEAQTLGILAVIAVGIILLCMWGGGGRTEDPGAMADKLANAANSEQGPTLTEREAQIPTGSTSEGERIEESVGEDMLDQEDADAVARFERGSEPTDIDMQASEDDNDESARPRQIRTHVVERGETLSSISKHYYDTVKHWKKLARVNKDVCPDPARMQPGMTLRIPYEDELDNTGSSRAQARRDEGDESETEQASDTDPSDGRVYVVKKDDTLYKIAQSEYGDGSKWKAILKANRQVIKSGTTIVPGMKLRLPNI